MDCTRGGSFSRRRSRSGLIKNHLVPAFGGVRLADLDAARLDSYVAAKRRAGSSPASINRHLNLTSKVLKTAAKRGLVRGDVVSLVDRPRESEAEWRILSPVGVRAVARVWLDYIAEADPESEAEERAWREAARVVFLMVSEVGLRRGEVRGLPWRLLSLADPEGAFLRVAETIVDGHTGGPKSASGRRTIPLSSSLAAALFDHRGRSAFDGDDDLVFVSPHRGCPLNPRRYAATLREVLRRAGIVDYVRPFQDGRHSSITNAAREGRRDLALMTLAGHSDFRTTRRYLHLAGEMFREEADRMGSALWGEGSGTKKRYQVEDAAPKEVPETA